MHLESILGYLITYRYFLIIPLVIVEGPIVMVLCGFLMRFGTFDIIPLYGALTIADLIGDIGWYCVGRFWGIPFINRFGKFFSVSQRSLDKASKLFNKYHNRILFISKITMGFGFALVTLITAGIAKVPFKKYLLYNVSGQLIWTGMLLGIGFLFGNIYTSIDKTFRNFAFAAIIIIAVALVYGIGRYVTKVIAEKI